MQPRLLALTALALIAAPALSAGAQKLRPWCDAGALNAAERTICATPEIARLDARLAELYGALRSGDAEQDGWLRGRRDDCGADIACLRAAYTERLRRIGADDAR